MKAPTRREFLKFGAALPLGLQSLALRAAEGSKSADPPRRIMFICNSLGFYEPYFFPKSRGDLSTSRYLAEMETSEKMTVFQNFFHRNRGAVLGAHAVAGPEFDARQRRRVFRVGAGVASRYEYHGDRAMLHPEYCSQTHLRFGITDNTLTG